MKYFEVHRRGDLHVAFLETHWERIVDTVKRAVTIAKMRIENSLDTNMQFIAALLPPLFRGSVKVELINSVCIHIFYNSYEGFFHLFF